MPGISTTISDFNLGRTGEVATVPQVVGPSSAGTVNTVTRFAKVNDVNDSVGYGPGPLLVQRMIQESGGAVDFVKCAASVAATGSAVTQTGGGGAVLMAPLAPYDRYNILVERTTTGAPGTGFFKISFDGGENYTAPAVIPTTLTSTFSNRNVRLIWENTSHTAGTVSSMTTTPPVCNASDIGSAFDAVQAEDLQPSFVAIALDPTTGSQGSALGTQALTEIAAYNALKQYPLFLLNAGTGSTSEIVPAWSSIEHKNLAVTVGTVQMPHPRPQPGYALPTVPFMYAVAGQAAKAKPQTGFDAVHLGNLGVSTPSVNDWKSGGNTGTWLPHKFIAPRTFPGSSAVYAMSSRMKAPDGSDFNVWEWARVVNIGTVAAEAYLQRFVNSSIRVIAAGNNAGKIDPEEAATIEAGAIASLGAVLNDPVDERNKKGLCSAFSFTVDRDNNLQQSKTLQCTLRIMTLGKAENINLSVGIAASI